MILTLHQFRCTIPPDGRTYFEVWEMSKDQAIARVSKLTGQAPLETRATGRKLVVEESDDTSMLNRPRHTCRPRYRRNHWRRNKTLKYQNDDPQLLLT